MSDNAPAETDIKGQGPSAQDGSAFYLESKRWTQALLDMYPPEAAFISSIDAGVKTTNALWDMNPIPGMATWGKMITGAQGAMMRGGVRAFSPTRENIEKHMLDSTASSSNAMADIMEMVGNMFPKPDEVAEMEHGLFTHNEDGSINRVPSAHIVPHFKQGQHDAWPQVILTANHALTREVKHVSGIMQNIHAMVKHITGKPINLARQFDESTQVVVDQTMMLSAVAAEKNSWLNGASLIRRYNYLKGSDDLQSRVMLDRKAKEYEKPTPGAARLAKLMLKMMVVNPESVDVDEARSFAEMKRDGDLPKEMPVLREDAIKIAKHITLVGYSKAANTVSDAVRFLAYELSATDKGGKTLFHNHGGKTLIQKQTPDGAARMRIEDIQPIIRHLGTIAIGGAEVPITAEEHALGMRRLRINGSRDLISGHFLSDKDSDVHRYETKSGNGLGHDPNLVLGGLEEGELHANPEIINKIAVVLAAKFGRIALAGVRRVDGADMGAGQTMELHFGPGASDKAIAEFAASVINQYPDSDTHRPTIMKKQSGVWSMRFEHGRFGAEETDRFAEVLRGINGDKGKLVVAHGVYENFDHIKNGTNIDEQDPMNAFWNGRGPNPEAGGKGASKAASGRG